MTSRITIQGLLYTLLIIAALLTSAGYLAYRYFQAMNEQRISRLLETNFAYLDALPMLAELYINTGVHSHAKRMKNYSETLEQTVVVLEKGGMKRIEEEEYHIEALQDQQWLTRLKSFENSFKIYKTNIDKLYEQPIFQNATSENELAKRVVNVTAPEIVKYLKNSHTEIEGKYLLMVQTVETRLEQHEKSRDIAELLLFFAVLASLATAAWFVHQHFVVEIGKLSALAAAIINGKLYQTTHLDYHDLSHFLRFVYGISRNTGYAAKFAQQIHEGKLDTNFKPSSEHDELGKSLVLLRDKLKNLADDEKERLWTVDGRREISEVLRTHQQYSLEDLSTAFVKKLVEYLGANQGGVFLIQHDEGEKEYVELVAMYAYAKKRYQQRRFSTNHGLVGQCLFEKATVYIENVPNEYLQVTSGLGESNPRCLLLVPIIANEEIFGVIEIASFTPLQDYKIRLAEVVSERLGATLSMSFMNLRTQKLLEQSTQLNADLREKEALMLENNKTLQDIQGTLSSKLSELEQETNLSKNILSAINKTNAAVEFDFDGNIIGVNDMYLRVMGYSAQELVGKNEKMLLAADELNSQRYELLWSSLNDGSSITGEYRRVTKNGKEVWLNGTYNPIFDVGGKPMKIIQFAQFTTEEKEKDLDFSAKINAINQAFPVVEIDVEGKIKTANPLFAKMMGLKRGEITGKNIVEFSSTPIPENFFQEVINGGNKSEALLFTNTEMRQIHCIANFSPVKNLSGMVHKIMILIIDVTKQKEAENELLIRKEELSQMVEALETNKLQLQEQEIKLRELLAKERMKNALLQRSKNSPQEIFKNILEAIMSSNTDSASISVPMVVHNGYSPALLLSSEGIVLDSNQQFNHLLNAQENALAQTPFRDLLIDIHEETLASMLRGDVLSTELVFQRADKSTLKIEAVSMPFFTDVLNIIIFFIQI